MKHHDFPARFRMLYDQAVARYAGGRRDVADFFTPAELTFLAANGIAAQHLYDYAEDDHHHGEPGFEHALAIECVRRDYFFNVQQGRASAAGLDAATLPGKTDALHGLTWLPRLLPKARAKLRGELPPSLMFCCGGDRAFFREHDILPAEFLALTARLDEAALIEWTVRRSVAAKSAAPA